MNDLKKETVSFEQLKMKLPESCYEAICKSSYHLYDENDEQSLYEAYFRAEPTKSLSEIEKKELLENLGNKLVKNHYSTETLRSFLEREPNNKKNRINNE